MSAAAGAKNFKPGVVAALVVVDLIIVVGIRLAMGWLTQAPTLLESVIHGLQGLLMLTFLYLARHEIILLVRRPGKHLGTGLSRIWAVGRTTILEAWAGRIWLLPVLWFLCASILVLAIVPFDESERIPLYIRTILSTQQVLVLVMMWVMACVSLPRERERKTLVTTASKPLSRLEILLGKFVGLGAATGMMLLVMMAMSLVMLYGADARLKTRAAEAYDLQRRDFDKTRITPSEGLLQLARQGSMFAYNNIVAPAKGGMNIGGMMMSTDPSMASIRYMIGGSNEKAIYKFAPRLDVPEPLLYQGPGRRPAFGFIFPMQYRTDKHPDVYIRVVAYAAGVATPIEKTIKLNAAGMGYWEPDQPEKLYSGFDMATGAISRANDRGMVTLEISCLTAGVVLEILEGADPDPITGEVPRDVASNVEFNRRVDVVSPTAAPSIAFPNGNPAVRGFERRERQEISGIKEKQDPNTMQTDMELAIYRFPVESLKHVPIDAKGNFSLAVELQTYKGDHPTEPTYAALIVNSMDPTVKEDFTIPRLEVLEKRVMKVDVPAAHLGKDGDLVVMVMCASPGQSLSLIENSVRIELPRTPFFVNFFKSECVIFIEALLLIAVSLTCSVRLGWAVSMFCSGIAVSFGMLVNYIASISEYGGLGALNYHPAGSNATLYNFFDKSASYLWQVLGFISSVVPNFTIFQPDQYISTLHNMPWSVIAWNTGNAISYAVPLLALAYLLFRKQELG